MKPFAGVLMGLISLVSVHDVRAQDGVAAFRWQKDQVFRYKVDHKTVAKDTRGQVENEVQTQINLIREWKVLEVDAKGRAKIQLKLLALKSATKRPDGEVLQFDSEKPDDATPQLRDQLARFIGEPVAFLEVDSLGKVERVIENRFGSSSRFETDPPFGVVLPGTAIKNGDSWVRTVHFTPVGSNLPVPGGGNLEARVKTTCAAATASSLTLRTAAQIGKQPEGIPERISLLQYFPDTEVVLDAPGVPPKLIVSKIDRSLKYGEKEESLYRLVSEYRETRIDE